MDLIEVQTLKDVVAWFFKKRLSPIMYIQYSRIMQITYVRGLTVEVTVLSTYRFREKQRF
ncbi:MAG: hypothetical protein CW691_09965 [Candidatus Bathyarchaeum sp.]|nr:MAG: hypothetical protein CW691_09965 [Candidatus Bathyarchaeum sp.]